jgi:hypothetical protein
VESEVVSEEQTFRSEDNAFLPLSSGQLSVLFITTLTNEATGQAPKKILKLHAWVSSRRQICPSLILTAESGISGETSFPAAPV